MLNIECSLGGYLLFGLGSHERTEFKSNTVSDCRLTIVVVQNAKADLTLSPSTNQHYQMKETIYLVEVYLMNTIDLRVEIM